MDMAYNWLGPHQRSSRMSESRAVKAIVSYMKKVNFTKVTVALRRTDRRRKLIVTFQMI